MRDAWKQVDVIGMASRQKMEWDRLVEGFAMPARIEAFKVVGSKQNWAGGVGWL